MRVCERCRKYLYPNSTKSWYCARCKVSSYCSRECQAADWGRHKAECTQQREEANTHRVPHSHVHGPPQPAASAGSASTSGERPPPEQERHVRPMCGLCKGRKPPFTYTECCQRVVCADTDNYVLMSYGRNSCARNHSRYTTCSNHHSAGHAGSWKDYQACKSDHSAYDWWTFGSNPPSQEACCNFPDDVLQEARPSLPRCVGCNRQVDTAAEAHSYGAGGLCCMACMYTT